jgi:hypothetical protein
MGKRIYIHIGPHKTGTTTIQNGLKKNEAILRARGVLVPKAGKKIAAHHNLAWELLGNKAFDRSDGTWEDLLSEIEGSEDINKVILTSEAFSAFGTDEIEAIKKHLNAYPIKIIIYLRRQDQALQSLWVQQVRSISVKPIIPSFVDWLEKNDYKTYNTDHYSLIKMWENVLSKKAITLVPFTHETVGKSLFEYFLSVCKVSYDGMSTPPNLNISPGVKTNEAMRMIKNNILFSKIRSEAWLKISKQIEAFGHTKGWNEHKLNYLDEALSAKIMAHHQDSNQKIADAYFDGVPLFEGALSTKKHVDTFTCDDFTKDEIIELFSFVLSKLVQS